MNVMWMMKKLHHSRVTSMVVIKFHSIQSLMFKLQNYYDRNGIEKVGLQRISVEVRKGLKEHQGHGFGKTMYNQTRQFCSLPNYVV
jgi:hypothetical protein